MEEKLILSPKDIRELTGFGMPYVITAKLKSFKMILLILCMPNNFLSSFLYSPLLTRVGERLHAGGANYAY